MDILTIFLIILAFICGIGAIWLIMKQLNLSLIKKRIVEMNKRRKEEIYMDREFKKAIKKKNIDEND